MHKTAAIWGALSVALVACAQPLRAAPAVDTAGASRCSTRAYLNDADPKGTNVRAAPSAKAPVIGMLPPRAKMKDDDEIVGVEVDIVGSKDGWLLVRNPDRGAFKGPGWIFGRLASGTIGSPKLSAAPADNAKVLATLQHAGETGIGPDSFEVMQVHACQGRYVEVTIRLAPSVTPYPGLPKQPMRGWVAKMCSTQLTTCDPN